jgi:sucrose phosphorylase
MALDALPELNQPHRMWRRQRRSSMTKKLSNQIMLITYPDSMGNNLKDLKKVLDKYFRGAIGGVHILPFFPSSADRGFCPTTYNVVDEAFGSWDDIEAIGEEYYLMYDYMINHLSGESEIYKDFLEKKDDSKYRDFFIRYKDFWSKGEPDEHDIEIMYRRKEIPWVEARFKDGTSEKIWTTFSDYQIDINQHSEEAKKFHRENLRFLSSHGGTLLRLDAVAYAAKKEGTSCFFAEPEIWELFDECDEILEGTDSILLPEIHEHCFMQQKVGSRGYYVYDFQLPMLLLNAIYFKNSTYLKNWMKICPRKQFTTLDTHDGIGVVDCRYLMPDEELLATRRHCFEMNPDCFAMYERAGQKLDLDKFDTLQINCTYYDAVGADDNLYYLARAVQFFTPGIPQLYYVGYFAGKNDFELYSKTLQNRDVNRHYYSEEEIEKESKRTIVKDLHDLMVFRNSHSAFNGSFSLLPSNNEELSICWENGVEYVILHANFITGKTKIAYSEKGHEKVIIHG